MLPAGNEPSTGMADVSRSRVPMRGTSHQLDRRIMNQPKVDRTDQPRPVRFRRADRALDLPQRADIGAERHDAAEHQRNRSERCDLTGADQAENGDQQQRSPAADRDLRTENELSAARTRRVARSALRCRRSCRLDRLARSLSPQDNLRPRIATSAIYNSGTL